MLSKASRKSTTSTVIGVCQSKHSSIMILKAVIWSMLPQPGRNPACSSLRSTSISSLILLNNILLRTDCRVVLLQSLMSERSPFFRGVGSLMRKSCFHSSGTFLRPASMFSFLVCLFVLFVCCWFFVCLVFFLFCFVC